MTTSIHLKVVLTLAMTLSGLSVGACRKPFEDTMRNGYKTQCDFSYRNQAPQAQSLKPINKTPMPPQSNNAAQQRRLQVLKNQIISIKK